MVVHGASLRDALQDEVNLAVRFNRCLAGVAGTMSGLTRNHRGSVALALVGGRALFPASLVNERKLKNA
jgi:hypothetical protein